MRIIKTYLPFIIGLLCGLYFITLQVTNTGLTFIPGDLGDGRFNNYLLEHAHQFFTAQIDSYWEANFMYPEGNVISYSDNLLGTAPFYSAFRLLGSDRETAFQYWFILLTIFNYTVSYFFLRYLFKNNYAAVCGALIFAFSLALQSQVGHAQTFPRFPIPLAFWAGILFLKELNPKYFLVLAMVLVYQVYCGIYLGFMLLIPIMFLMAISFYTHRDLYKLKLKNRKWLVLMAGAIVLSILLLLPVMIPYIERAKYTGLYPYQKIKESLPTILSFFYSRPGSGAWDVLDHTAINYPAFWDHQIFPGGIATLGLFIFSGIVIVNLVKRSRMDYFRLNSSLVLIFIVGFLTFLFFMRIGDFSLYRIIYYLPGYGSMRALQRIINIELLFYAIGVTYVLNQVFTKKMVFNAVIFILFVSIIIFDNYLHPDHTHHHNKDEAQARITLLNVKLKTVSPDFIISYEPDTLTDKCIYYQLDAMLAAQDFHFKTLNGYTSTCPYTYMDYWLRPDEKSRMSWLKSSGMEKARVAIIH